MTFRNIRKAIEGHSFVGHGSFVRLKTLLKPLAGGLMVVLFLPLSLAKSAPAASTPEVEPTWHTQLVLAQSPDLLVNPVQTPTIEKVASRDEEEQAKQAAAKAAAEKAAAEAKAKADADRNAQIASTACNPNISEQDKENILKQAADTYHIPVQLLQAVHSEESGNSVCSYNASSAGAQGPFQFLMSTWAKYAVDGNGDGIKDVHDMRDAAFGAAQLLAANGAAQGDFRRALFAYNHANWYVNAVLQKAGM